MSSASSRPPHLIEACNANANYVPRELFTKGCRPIGPNSPEAICCGFYSLASSSMATLPFFPSHATRFLAGPRLEATLRMREEEKRDFVSTKEWSADLCRYPCSFRSLECFHLLPWAYEDMCMILFLSLILLEQNNCPGYKWALPNKFSLSGTERLHVII